MDDHLHSLIHGYILLPEVIHHEIASLVADLMDEKQSDVFAKSRLGHFPRDDNHIEYRFEYRSCGTVIDLIPSDLAMHLDPFSRRFLAPAAHGLVSVLQRGR